MTDLTTTIDTHLTAYCEPEPVARRRLVEAAWAADGELLDPPLEGRGLDEIAALTDVVLAHYPGHRFERTTDVDEHHGFARYGWRLVGPDGTVSVTGTDVANVDDDGRLVKVVGFFGDLAPVS